MENNIRNYRGYSLKYKQWFCGGLVTSQDEYYICFFSRSTENKQTLENVLVDKNSIGQNTGLKDKNGKEIYGGDILKIYDAIFEGMISDGSSDGASELWIDVISQVIYDSGSYCWEDPDTCLPIAISEVSEYKIIGKNYENPELLEVNNGK